MKYLFLPYDRPKGESPEPGSDEWMETLGTYQAADAARGRGRRDDRLRAAAVG